MKNFLILYVLLLFSCSSEKQQALVWEKTCSNFEHNLTQVNYCLNQIKGGKKATLLAFHGMGGNEQDFMNELKNFQNNPDTITAILTVSFGPQWILAQPGKTETLEALLNHLSSTKLFIYGLSMGGHNALKFSKNRDNVLAVAIACPAVFDKNARYWLQAADLSLGLTPDIIVNKLTGFFAPNTDPEFARLIFREADYKNLINQATWPKHIFIHANEADHFPSFFEGATNFAKSLGTPLFKPTPGGHCESIPVQQIQEFFSTSWANNF